LIDSSVNLNIGILGLFVNELLYVQKCCENFFLNGIYIGPIYGQESSLHLSFHLSRT